MDLLKPFGQQALRSSREIITAEAIVGVADQHLGDRIRAEIT
jgi:hypothetical protein